MKVTDLAVTMINWKSDAWQTGRGDSFGGGRVLGVVTVSTDEGIEGHSFLGSSRSLAGKPLAGFCATPIRRIPVLCGTVIHVLR